MKLIPLIAALLLLTGCGTAALDTERRSRALAESSGHMAAAVSELRLASVECTDADCMLTHLGLACEHWQMARDALPESLRDEAMGEALRRIVEDHCALSPAGRAAADAVERMAGEYSCGTLRAIADKPDVNVEIEGLPDDEAIRVMQRAMKAARREFRARC